MRRIGGECSILGHLSLARVHGRSEWKWTSSMHFCYESRAVVGSVWKGESSYPVFSEPSPKPQVRQIVPSPALLCL